MSAIRRFLNRFRSPPVAPPDLPSVGDLARVVRVHGCPGSIAARDHYVTVTALLAASHDIIIACGYCRETIGHVEVALLDSGGGLPRAWLRRIPPITELERTDIFEELDAERPRRVMA